MLIFCGKVLVHDVREMIARVNAAADAAGSTIVLFDAERIAGFEHVRSAAVHAARSFAEKRNIARTLEMEMLVYASGQRQCSLAAKFGLHAGENEVYVLILGGDEGKAKAMLAEFVDEAPQFSVNVKRLRELFDISDAELAVAGTKRVEELVVERVALVDAWK